MPPDLYGVPLRARRHALTDEVDVEYIDKVTEITYQIGSVMVPRGATEVDIRNAIGARIVELEAEAATPAPDAPAVPEIPLPSAVLNKTFDREGEFKRR